MTSGNDNWSCDGGISLSDTNQDEFGKELLLCKKVFSRIYIMEIIGLITKKYLYAQSSGDWSCSPNTDYTNYANRQININGPLTIYETWGS